MTNASSVKDDELCNKCLSHYSDFTFGFNDSRFSDCVLNIEILADDDATHKSQTQPNDLHCAENGAEPSCLASCRFMKFHVSSILLAAKSPFFHNLFTDGLTESEQRGATLRIHSAEETAVMELLKYTYSGTLTATSAPSLLDVLKLADKFQVVSCMRLSANLLLKLPMSTETALLYLTSDLPVTDEVQLLANAAKQFLQTRYKDIDKSWTEIMEIPLVGIEVILSGDVLEAASEDIIFDLALKWAEAHYPDPEDRRKILSVRLGPYIRFPYMSVDKLREVLSSNDFVYKAVIDALFFKIKNAPPHRTATKEDSSSEPAVHRPYVRRAYGAVPITVLECESPCHDIVVYLKPKFDQCASLKPSESLFSETHDFRGSVLYLYVRCSTGTRESLVFSVGLGFKMHKSSKPYTVEYEFSCRSESTKKFVQKKSGSRRLWNYGENFELYETPWDDFKCGRT